MSQLPLFTTDVVRTLCCIRFSSTSSCLQQQRKHALIQWAIKRGPLWAFVRICYLIRDEERDRELHRRVGIFHEFLGYPAGNLLGKSSITTILQFDKWPFVCRHLTLEFLNVVVRDLSFEMLPSKENGPVTLLLVRHGYNGDTSTKKHTYASEAASGIQLFLAFVSKAAAHFPQLPKLYYFGLDAFFKVLRLGVCSPYEMDALFESICELIEQWQSRVDWSLVKSCLLSFATFEDCSHTLFARIIEKMNSCELMHSEMLRRTSSRGGAAAPTGDDPMQSFRLFDAEDFRKSCDACVRMYNASLGSAFKAIDVPFCMAFRKTLTELSTMLLSLELTTQHPKWCRFSLTLLLKQIEFILAMSWKRAFNTIQDKRGEQLHLHSIESLMEALVRLPVEFTKQRVLGVYDFSKLFTKSVIEWLAERELGKQLLSRFWTLPPLEEGAC